MPQCSHCRSPLGAADTFCGTCGRPQTQAGRAVLVGRDPGCDVVVSHPKVSAHHCRLTFRGSEVTLEDLGSSNGTFVGHDRRPVHGQVVLRPGEPVHVGPTLLDLAQVARQVGIVWQPAPGVARTVLDAAQREPPPAPVANLELERQRLRAEQEADERARKMEHAIELERQRLQAEREAAERAREAALDMARQAELAATRAAAEAAQAQALAQAQAKARDNRSGWQKGSDAAGSVAGFGCGCIGYIVLAIVLFFGLLLLLAALGK